MLLNDFFTAPALGCYPDDKHIWVPTGRGIYLWDSQDTKDTLPIGTPFFQEERCTICGVIRNVPRGHYQNEP